MKIHIDEFIYFYPFYRISIIIYSLKSINCKWLEAMLLSQSKISVVTAKRYYRKYNELINHSKWKKKNISLPTMLSGLVFRIIYSGATSKLK